MVHRKCEACGKQFEIAPTQDEKKCPKCRKGKAVNAWLKKVVK